MNRERDATAAGDAPPPDAAVPSADEDVLAGLSGDFPLSPSPDAAAGNDEITENAAESEAAGDSEDDVLAALTADPDISISTSPVPPAASAEGSEEKSSSAAHRSPAIVNDDDADLDLDLADGDGAATGSFPPWLRVLLEDRPAPSATPASIPSPSPSTASSVPSAAATVSPLPSPPAPAWAEEDEAAAPSPATSPTSPAPVVSGGAAAGGKGDGDDGDGEDDEDLFDAVAAPGEFPPMSTTPGEAVNNNGTNAPPLPPPPPADGDGAMPWESSESGEPPAEIINVAAFPPSDDDIDDFAGGGDPAADLTVPPDPPPDVHPAPAPVAAGTVPSPESAAIGAEAPDGPEPDPAGDFGGDRDDEGFDPLADLLDNSDGDDFSALLTRVGQDDAPDADAADFDAAEEAAADAVLAQAGRPDLDDDPDYGTIPAPAESELGLPTSAPSAPPDGAAAEWNKVTEEEGEEKEEGGEAPAIDPAALFAGLDDPDAFSFDDDGMDDEMRALQAENDALDADPPPDGSPAANEPAVLAGKPAAVPALSDWRGWLSWGGRLAARGGRAALARIPEGWRQRAVDYRERVTAKVAWRDNWRFYINALAALLGAVSLAVLMATYWWG